MGEEAGGASRQGEGDRKQGCSVSVIDRRVGWRGGVRQTCRAYGSGKAKRFGPMKGVQIPKPKEAFCVGETCSDVAAKIVRQRRLRRGVAV